MPDIEKNGYGIPAQIIQGGCKLLDKVTGTFLYEFEDNNGLQKYVFTASVTPKLGDRIVNGVLVPRDLVAAPDNELNPIWPEPLINNDPGFQAKGIHDYTWPEDYKG